jgi:3-phosphoshikimate 1-carboxyvinyltransferase
LLLSAPYARRDVEIEVTGTLVSSPYVDLTLGVMAAFGVRAYREGYEYFKVEAGQPYRSRRLLVEGDVSSASYFWAAAAVTGGSVTTKNINAGSRQGDMGFLAVLQDMGCRVEPGDGEIRVHGRGLCGVDADMSAMPDLVPTLAAIAPFAKGRTVIRNVSHLRYKESDRLAAVAREWTRLGCRVDEHADGLTVYGDQKLSGDLVDPHGDHRIAMSLAVIGLRVPGIRIANEGCVDKSFPGFWETWERV